MFGFQKKHFKQCVDHPLFIEGHRLFIEECSGLNDPNMYQGDPELLKPLASLRERSPEWKAKLYEIFKDKPFPYFD